MERVSIPTDVDPEGEQMKKPKEKESNKKVYLNRFIAVNISYPLHTDISSALV